MLWSFCCQRQDNLSQDKGQVSKIEQNVTENIRCNTVIKDHYEND